MHESPELLLQPQRDDIGIGARQTEMPLGAQLAHQLGEP